MDNKKILRAFAIDGSKAYATPYRSIHRNAWDLGDGGYLCYVDENGALSIPAGATVTQYPKVLMPVYNALLSNTYRGDRAEPYLTFNIAIGAIKEHRVSMIKSEAMVLTERMIFSPKDFRQSYAPSLNLLRRPAALRWYVDNAPFGIGYGAVPRRRRREKSRGKTYEVEHKVKANFIIGADRLRLYDFAPVASQSREEFNRGILHYPRPYHGNTNHDHFWPGLWSVPDELVNFNVYGKLIEIEQIRAYGYTHRDFDMLPGNFIEISNVHIEEVYERVIAL